MILSTIRDERNTVQGWVARDILKYIYLHIQCEGKGYVIHGGGITREQCKSISE